MLKLTAIGHADVVDDAIDRLQRAGVVEIERRESEHDAITEMVVDESRLHRVEKVLAEAQFVRDFLRRYHEPDVAFGTFIGEKIHLLESEFLDMEPDEEFFALYRECDRVSARIADIDREVVRLKVLVVELEPWRDLHLQISEWKGTEHVGLFTGTVPLAASDVVRQALRDEVEEVTVAEVGRDHATEAWVVMAHRSLLDTVKSELSLTDFTQVEFPELTDYPAEEIARGVEALTNHAKERAGLEERARALAEHYPHTVALVEALHTDYDALQVRSCFNETDRTFVLTGWVPEHRQEKLTAAFAPIGSDIDLTFEQPNSTDAIPVELKNSRIVRPFEVLTDLYGRPDYYAFDPTPIMAPFFFLFFGMCLGDVGYGFMLMGGCWLIKTKLDVALGVKKFMDLLILGGLAAAIWGALTRSYMAIQVDKLPAFLHYKPLIDPQSELILLLGVSVAIGVVHVSIGVGLAAHQLWRRGEIIDAISDHVSVLVFFALLIVSLLGFVGIAAPGLAGPLLIAGFVQLVLLKGRVLDIAFGRVPAWHVALIPFKGFLGLYEMVSFGSDFLSYTRLAALGLASLYVGDAMNRLTELSGGIPWVGWLLAALIFVVGHTFNVVINMLGAFVHPTRLLYVEFFGKFYEGGGRAFAPFAPRTRQLVLHPHPVGEQEGGVGS